MVKSKTNKLFLLPFFIGVTLTNLGFYFLDITLVQAKETIICPACPWGGCPEDQPEECPDTVTKNEDGQPVIG